MRVLLISASQGIGIQPVVPLGALYVAAALEKENYLVEILDLGFSKDPLKDIRRAILEFSPDVTGISIRNIAETNKLNHLYGCYCEIVKEVKKNSIVVLGGSGFSLFPNEILEHTGADYGIVGEGEYKFIKLLEAIKQRKLSQRCIKSFNNLKQPEGLVKTCEVDIMKARWKHWNKYGKYYSMARSPIPIQTSRGCPLSCSYCSYPLIQGNKLRLRSAEDVVKEFRALSKLPGAEEAFVVDSAMNADYEHILSITTLLKEELKISNIVRWQCCLNPIDIDDKLAFLLTVSGCNGCELGVDSFSDIVLSNLNKGFNSKQAYNSAKTLQKAGITYSLSLILGAPGETMDTLNETLSFVKRIVPQSVHAFIGVRLYPDTSLIKKVNRLKDNLLWPKASSFYISKETVEPLKKLVLNPPQGWNFTNADMLFQKDKE